MAHVRSVIASGVLAAGPAAGAPAPRAGELRRPLPPGWSVRRRLTNWLRDRSPCLLGADLKATSVSGLSSGAFMAQPVPDRPFGYGDRCRHRRRRTRMAAPRTRYPCRGREPGGKYLPAVRWSMAACSKATRLRRSRYRITGRRASPCCRPSAASMRSRAWRAAARIPVQRLQGSIWSCRAMVTAAEELYANLGVRSYRATGRGPAGHGFITEKKGIACGQTGRRLT